MALANSEGMMKTLKRLSNQIYRIFFGNRHFYKFNQKLVELGLRGLGFLNTRSVYISGEAAFIKKIFKQNAIPTILDVGGNDGEYAKCIRRFLPNAELLSFEPNPSAFRALQQASQRFGYQAFNIGLSCARGKKILYDDAGSEGHPCATFHIESFRELSRQPYREVMVEVDTLDHIVEMLKIKKIDLLKIDTEGHEFDVLCGAKESIASGIIQRIQFEYSFINSYLRRTLRDFQSLLPGYRLMRILPNGDAMPLSTEPAYMRELYAFHNIIAYHEEAHLSSYP